MLPQIPQEPDGVVVVCCVHHSTLSPDLGSDSESSDDDDDDDNDDDDLEAPAAEAVNNSYENSPSPKRSPAKEPPTAGDNRMEVDPVDGTTCSIYVV